MILEFPAPPFDLREMTVDYCLCYRVLCPAVTSSISDIIQRFGYNIKCSQLPIFTIAFEPWNF